MLKHLTVNKLPNTVITRHLNYEVHNTFRMKVKCALYVEVTEEADLQALDWDSLPQPLMVIGGGSNLLFTGDFPGTVLHVAITKMTPGPKVTVGAGVVFDDFCAWAADNNLWGPENLSLIPGEVGASAVQNIGAYGVEAKDIIAGIRAWDLQNRKFVDIDPADCEYGYRTSRFKTEWKGRFVITAVTYKLSKDPKPILDYGGVRMALEESCGDILSQTCGHPRPHKREGPIADGRGRGATVSGIDTTSAKFIYVIPDFNNPSGKTMTLEEREEVVRVARELDCLIVEDSPYRELRYSGEPVKTIREMAPERTLHLGSFSKIFAPGFRLGWIIGPEPLLEQIYVCKQCLDLCPPVLDQYMAAEFMGSGALDANLVKTIAEYRRRRDLMVGLLEKYMPSGVSWTYPDGGLFLWLTLPDGADTVVMYDEALSKGVAYVAGSFFYTDGSHRNTMRLNFSFVEESKMEPGIKLLSSVITNALKHSWLSKVPGC